MVNNIKLLLHAEDGSFPYLSNHLLLTYFNPEDELVKDHLTIGIAVKDTCVVPLYNTETKVKVLKRKRSNNDDHENEKDPEVKRQNEITKPSGYTFDANPLHEMTRLLSGYDTMVVPSFDLLDDARAAIEKDLTAKNKKQKTVNGNAKGNNTKVSSIIMSTKDKSSLMTPNGVQQISPTMYVEVGMKLRCNAMLSLFDQAHQDDGKRRRESATERTKEWLITCLSALKAIGEVKEKYLWGALSCVSSDEVLLDSINDLTHEEDLLKGIAVIGWHHIHSRDERIKLLKKVEEKVSPETHLCVLATSTLEQFLDAAESGVGTIGTSLPVVWTRSNKAMFSGLDIYNQSEEGRLLDIQGCMDLLDEKYRNDESPILPNCLCLACKNGRHSKAYIHHLIKANELLAQILVFGHNLNQMLVLCQLLSKGRT